MLTLVIDGQPFTLASHYDEAELRVRIHQAVFRAEVEVFDLADGETVLVNWRAVRTVQLLTEPQPGAHAGL